MNFTEDLNNASSPQFKSLASTVERSLLPPLKVNLPAVEAVQVYNFKEGSVIAEYFVITAPDAVVNASMIQKSVQKTISSGSIENLNVDTDFVPSVESKYFAIVFLKAYRNINI